MEDHPQFAEDIDLYALGALEGEEKRTLEGHLAACDDCQRKLEDARGLIAAVSLAAPPLAPPAGARDRLLEAVRARSKFRDEPAAERPTFWRWPNLVWAFATLALLIGVTLTALDNRRLLKEAHALRERLDRQTTELGKAQAALQILRAPDTMRVHLVSGMPKPVPEGKVFYHSHHGLLFFASHLRPLERNKTYELWLIPSEGKPMNCGTFQTDERWEGSVLLPPMPAMPANVTPKAFAVTVEPAGGMPWPTGPQVLAGGL
jgi:anti-sigma-K factor RskA